MRKIEALQISLKPVDTNLESIGKVSQRAKGFLDILNITLEEAGKILEEDPEEEHVMAYLLDNPMLAKEMTMEHDSLEVDILGSNLGDVELENGNFVLGEVDMEEDIVALHEINSKEIETLEFEKDVNLQSLDRDKIDPKVEFSKLVELEGELQNSKAIEKNVETKDIKSNPITGKEKLEFERVNLKEDIPNPVPKEENLDKFDLKDLPKNLEDKTLKTSKNIEKIEEKTFGLEEIQNSFRKIEIKHLDDISPEVPKLSQENMEIFKDSIIELIEIRGKGESSTMNVKLIPKELGSIDIKMNMEEGKLGIKIFFENEQARQLFASNMDSLNQNLQRENILIDEIQMDLNLNSESGESKGRQGREEVFQRNNKQFEKVKSFEKTPRENRNTIQSGLSILA